MNSLSTNGRGAILRHGVFRLRSWLSLWLMLALELLLGQRVRGENHVDYRYDNYREDDGRIHVRTHSALLEMSLRDSLSLNAEFVYDAISGATPTGGPPPAGSNQVPLARMEDERWAGNLSLPVRWGRHTTTPQFAYSLEGDYESVGLSLNHTVDFNDKNTTLALGLAFTHDTIMPDFWFGDKEYKNGGDFLVGLTQLLGPKTFVTANLTFGTAHGYLADPYKGFRFTGYPDPEALFPEKRPGHRTKQILSTTLTQSLEPLDASPELTYRFYHDSHDILSHTVTLEWFQSLGPRLIVAPLVRYYHQSEAYFYRLSYDADPTYPQTPPVPLPQFYSADYRLSLFRSLTYGISLTFKVGRHMVFDAAYKRYDMVGLDGETPQSSYPTANIYTVGFRIFF